MLNLLNNVVAAAAEGGVPAVSSFDLEGILSSAVTTVQGYVFTTLATVVPSIVGIMGVVVAVKFGIRWIKKMGQG
ncbi:MAG: hypothetical protein NC306_15145 [Butyrivibrio sp.]|nr:hypothetical protein [Butyrivibrio sp.]